ncbi:MAG: SH3 domain-containing protein [Candidatus Riflebacteria bacterium]|nr:SH3 domain-containing protein [Candidatus Riflebacteria bacterium]
MRNISSLIKSSKQTAIVFSLFLALVASVSFCEDPFSGDSKITEEETSKPKVEITETEIATAAGIEKIEEGYPIEGKIAANNLRLRSWPWGAVVGKYTKGQSVKVLGTSGEFYLVEVNGQQGYMHKSYITTEKTQASFAAPSYPGDTRSGGYVPLKDGISASNTGSTKKNNEDNNNNNSSNDSNGSINNLPTSDYEGVTKAIYDIVKKFCDANEAYVLGAAHSKNSGYAKKSDCSGFTGQFINKLSELAGVKPVIGDSFPTSTNYANSQYTQKVTGTFPPPDPKDLIKPGDIFVMKKSSPTGYGHVGVFMGYNSAGQPLIAHSTTRKVDGKTTMGKLGTTGVRVEPIPSWYKDRWMGIYRLINMNEIANKLDS